MKRLFILGGLLAATVAMGADTVSPGIAEAMAAAFPTATGGPGDSVETAWRLGAETEYDETMLRALLPQNYQNMSVETVESENGRFYTVLTYSLEHSGNLQEHELWVDVHDTLMRTLSAVRAAQTAARHAPQGALALHAELWALYCKCCRQEGAVNTEPLRERILQLQDPAHVYLAAVYFMECMPNHLPGIADLPESLVTEVDRERDERVFTLWSHRRVVKWYFKEALILMARNGDAQALQYAARLVRDYPGDNPFDAMYQRETEKLQRGEVADTPLIPEI